MNTIKSKFDLSKCARPNILALRPYRCARDDYKDDGTNILLDANENAYGSGLNSPKDDGHLSNGAGVGHTAQRPVEVDLQGLNRYPDPHRVELKTLWCKLRNTHHHTSKKLNPENTFLGVGSDEALSYDVSVNDLHIVEVPLNIENSFALRPTAINDALSADDLITVVCICSPGNPTAKSISKGDLQQILEHPTWNGVVVLDEAYIDFSPEGSSLAEFVTEWPNLIVMQTLSKGFGLAGIRLGAAFTSPSIAQLLNNLKAPYDISSPTSALAYAALEPNNLQVMRANIEKIVKQRKRMLQELPRITGVGRCLGGTDSNLLYEILDKPRVEGGKPCNEIAMIVHERLAESKGIVVRFRGKEVGCLGCLRITVGTEREVDRLVEQMEVVLGGIFSQAKGKENPNQETKEVEANDVVA